MYVVGAANSAGQAVLNFSRHAKRVVMVVRGARLEDHMSQYLVARIRAAENVEVLLRTEVVAARGDGHLEAITLADRETGTEREVSTSWLFVFIGMSPRTGWLGDDIVRDPQGLRGHRPGPDGRRRAGEAGRSPGRRTPSRPASRASSLPVTSASTR